MAGRSAAYVIAIVSALAFIIGALVLTAVDPVMQALFASPSWSSSTRNGTDLLMWLSNAWAFVPASLLIAITIQIWIDTRQPT